MALAGFSPLQRALKGQNESWKLPIFSGKIGFRAHGLGFNSRKHKRKWNGIKTQARQSLELWDLCTWTILGFSQNLG